MKLIQDLKAFSNNSIKQMIVTFFTNPCFHAVWNYRIASFFYKCHLSIISKVIWYIGRLLYHMDIDYRAKLAGGFVVKHGLGLVIGAYVESKGKLTVYQGVTLGGDGTTRMYEEKQIVQPIIMDNVTIFTDAKVFGPVIIGKNNKIKAGAIIHEDIADKEEQQ